MKKKTPASKGNKDKHSNSLHNKPPEKNDDPRRHHPPTPQDIHQVQPLSQTRHDQAGKPGQNINRKDSH